ncbi:MAG: NYN domain-containing protein [Actinomycetota bacterium]
MWVIDGNNVMGAAGDGWWNDPLGAAERLTQQIAVWARDHDDDVVVVYDGASHERLRVLAGGNLQVEFASRRGRDAADDRVVEIVEDALVDIVPSEVTVVTSDRGLIDRLAPGVVTLGAGRFRRRLS